MRGLPVSFAISRFIVPACIDVQDNHFWYGDLDGCSVFLQHFNFAENDKYVITTTSREEVNDDDTWGRCTYQKHKCEIGTVK